MPRIAMFTPRRCSQIAGLAIERLHDAAGVVEEDRPVVRKRGRLIRSALVHGPDPLQLEILGVVARDLRQRAVTRGELIVPQHRPVTRRRVAQHLVGDAREVLHLAFHGEPDRRRLLPSSASTSGGRTLWTGAATRGCRCLRGGRGSAAG
jgi:hypothetical protein